MRKKIVLNLIAIFLTGIVFAPAAFASWTDGAIDATDKYAWGENIGWLDFGTSAGDVSIADTALTGYVWSENSGWISLNCANDLSCGGVDYGVVNDGAGNLSGYAWSENAGWINFNPTFGGVSINSSGEFSGYAWGENIGWIVFNCSATDSCAAVDYKVKTDWRPASERTCTSWTYSDWSGCSGGRQARTVVSQSPAGCSGGNPVLTQSCTVGGGGLAPEAYNPPSKPQPTKDFPQGFGALINGGDAETDSRDAIITLRGGADARKMAISNSADFNTAEPENYKETKNWRLTEGEGIKTVYVIFYTAWGKATEPVSASIILKYPAVKGDDENKNQADDKNRTKNNVSQNEKPRPIEDGGATKEQNKGAKPTVKPPQVPPGKNKQPAALPSKKEEKKSILDNLPEKIEDIIPDFLKPEKEAEKRPDIAPPVPMEAPLSLKGGWKLLPERQLGKFVLAPLPNELNKLTEKFPELESVFNKIGISKLSGAPQLNSVELKLPGLTEAAGIKKTELASGKMAIPEGIPLAQLSPQLKQALPTEVLFAKTGKELIDFNITLTVNDKGKPQQKITTVAKGPLRLAIKPEGKADSVKGYLAFKSKNDSALERRPLTPISKKGVNEAQAAEKNGNLLDGITYKLQDLFSSFIFGEPALAEQQEKPIDIEEKLVLMEFDYGDADGDGIYTADIEAPSVEGEYEIITVINYIDPELGTRALRLTTVVDPEGYVFEKYQDKEMRVPNAAVSLNWLNPETEKYEIWPAAKFNQENPQITDATGKYSFLVPEGDYYLAIEAPGYLKYEGKPFKVSEGGGVHFNVELKTKYWQLKSISWQTVLLAIVLLLLAYNFYKDKLREKKGKI